jgi:hypothetical protein
MLHPLWDSNEKKGGAKKKEENQTFATSPVGLRQINFCEKAGVKRMKCGIHLFDPLLLWALDKF